MNRWMLGLAALVVAATLPAAPAKARTSFDIDVRIGDRYRGDAIYFRREPEVVVVPNSRVYYVRNYDRDLYRYGRYWYFVEDGYWYRARSWRGPFINLRVSSVPYSVRSVPVSYRRHWYGSRAVARGRYDRDRDRDWDRDRNRYRDRDRNRDRDWDRDYRR